jgi:hypothetical protein
MRNIVVVRSFGTETGEYVSNFESGHDSVTINFYSLSPSLQRR